MKDQKIYILIIMRPAKKTTHFNGWMNWHKFIYPYIQPHNMDTSIRLDSKVRDELKDLGKKGERYSDIIKKLIEEHKQK